MAGDMEFWRWEEYGRRLPGIEWQGARTVCAGVDIGSIGSKAAVMVDGKLYATSVMRTGSNSPDSARKVLEKALEGTGLGPDHINYTVGTGYGRVNVPFAKKTVTEISCHARGANFIWGSKVRTILDVGGQDIKAIRCDEGGNTVSFLMNDKCAAGTGRGMEVFADLLQIPITEVGAMSLDVPEEPPPVSSTCVVFAKSEASSLLRKGWPKNKVLAAYCSAMAHRIVTLLERVGIEKDFAITGGIAKNIGVVERLKSELKIDIAKTQLDPQIAGALGAALFGKTLIEKGKA